MSYGIQIFDSKGNLTFDATKHRIINYLGVVNFNWYETKVIWTSSTATRKVYRSDLTDLGKWSLKNTIVSFDSSNGAGRQVQIKDGYLIADAVISTNTATDDKLPTECRVLRF